MNGAEMADTASETGELRYRYAVVEVSGEVPEQIRNMLDKPDAYLLYKENRGSESQQDFMSNHRHAGGWYMERRGAVRVIDGKVVREYSEDYVADAEGGMFLT